MSNQLERLYQQLIPFLIAGIAIALFIGLFIFFSYVVVWGLIIGVSLWLIALVKNLLFPRKKTHLTKGNIIDHHDQD
jgi:hypothetical protein